VYYAPQFNKNEVTTVARDPAQRDRGVTLHWAVGVALEIVNPHHSVRNIEVDVPKCVPEGEDVIGELQLQFVDWNFLTELILHNYGPDYFEAPLLLMHDTWLEIIKIICNFSAPQKEPSKYQVYPAAITRPPPPSYVKVASRYWK